MSDRDTAVSTRVGLVDPETMRVVWVNEAAAPAQPGDEDAPGLPIERFLPLADALGLPGALREAADTGVPRHLSTDLVSTSSGSMAMVASVYRLPDGMLLVVAENAWQVGRKETVKGAPRRHGRRGTRP